MLPIRNPVARENEVALEQPDIGTLANQFFAGHVEQTYIAVLRVPDPDLHDYVTEVLQRLIDGALFPSYSAKHGLAAQIAKMRDDAEQRIGLAQLISFKRLGDSVLAIYGLFPEGIERGTNSLASSEDSAKRTSFDSKWWAEIGRNAFARVAELIVSPDYEKFLGNKRSTFTKIADQFEMVAYGIRAVRESWERSALEG